MTNGEYQDWAERLRDADRAIANREPGMYEAGFLHGVNGAYRPCELDTPAEAAAYFVGYKNGLAFSER